MSGSIAATGRRGGEGAKDAAGAAGGVTDHGALTGLGDNDHPQYALSRYKATITVGAGGATSLLFSGLDGNTHKRYRITGGGPNAGASTLTVKFNGTLAANYSTMAHSTGSNVVAGSSLWISAMAANATHMFEFLIDAHLNAARQRVGQMYTMIAYATGLDKYLGGCRWNNTVDNLTSIEIIASIANSFSEGYQATIEEVG